MDKNKFIYYISVADDIFRNGQSFDKACVYYKKAKEMYNFFDEAIKKRYLNLMLRIAKSYCNYIKDKASEEYKKKNYSKALLLYEDLLFERTDIKTFPFFEMGM